MKMMCATYGQTQSSYRKIIDSRFINMCRLLKKPALDPFLRIVIAQLSKYTDLYDNCPIRKVVLNFVNLLCL